MTKIKPVAGIKHEELLHDVYWRQFKAHKDFLDNNTKNFDELLLSGLFLSLTFEAFINHTIEFLLENINRRENRRIESFYKHQIKNSPKIGTKFLFLTDIFLADNLCLKEKETITTFINDEWTPLRNKIVHGNEFWILQWSDGSVGKSHLAEKLSKK